MAQITKTVDKTLVHGSEVFIYTINTAYSGLTIPAQEGKIIDVFPNKIQYILPPVGGQIKRISKESVAGGTQVTFHLGSVNSGTSLSFTVACNFGPGRVDDDSYTNQVQLVADDAVVATNTAPTVRLKLSERFELTKFAKPSNAVNAGDELTFVLSLTNNGDIGGAIKNVVVKDALPPQLTPIKTFTPVGNDVTSGWYSDSSADGLTGSWDGNTLTFQLPKYHGARYDIMFKAKVADSVALGQTFDNIGTWTMNGNPRNNAPLTLLIYDPNAVGFEFSKLGVRSTMVGAPINYQLRNSNTGNIALSNYELEDLIPSQVDITAFRLEASYGLINYSIYIALASNPSLYIPVITDQTRGSALYFDLSPLIPKKDRVAKIKLTAQNLSTRSSYHSLFIYGTTNSTAVMGSMFTNQAVAKSGDITQTKLWNTMVSDISDLSIEKEFSPVKKSYSPLEEFNVILTGGAINTISINPILADLMPKGLHYVVDSEYFLYEERLTGITYDSRKPDFPVPLPTRQVIANFSNTDDTLIRWNFSNYILPRYDYIKIVFKVFVGIDTPSSFVNKGYMGVPGNNIFWANNQVIDTLDVDGDGLTTDRISYQEVSGVVLSTSEFSLKKLVKGQNDFDYDTSGVTIQGGDIDYKLQITNNQPMDLKDIEIVDILPFIGDTGVILSSQKRGSQFDVYAASAVTAQIINLLDDPVEKNPAIAIEYSTSNDPKRFDELGNEIGTGDWSKTPPADITTTRSIKVTTDSTVTLRPYDRLVIHFKAKAPVGTPIGKIAYNSYAVRANKITSSGTEPLLPTEPNKVSVIVGRNGFGTIGDLVWEDSNQNGLYDEEEVGINGVTVALYDDHENLLKTTVTANNFEGNPGYYLFTGLEDGVYQVKFSLLDDYLFTKQQSSEPNGSKPDPDTGLTAYITMSNQQQLLDVDAGLTRGKPPVITASDQCVPVGEVFDPMVGVTATDGNGVDITDRIEVVSNDVDTATAGEYTVTYGVTDSQGQTATSTVQVVVCKASPREQAITDIFESVALEQTALSHILNAEGEKIQKAVAIATTETQMLEINRSVESMVYAIRELERVLQGKLQLFQEGACFDDCCNQK